METAEITLTGPATDEINAQPHISLEKGTGRKRKGMF